MKKEKVGLREQLLKKAKTIDEFEEKARQLNDELCWGNRKDIGVKFPRTPLTQEEYNAKAKEYHEEKWVKLSDVESFLEPSPQTREIQKLLENLREKIAEALKYASLPKKKAVSALLDEALPKLETLLADHVSREEVRKLIEDFPNFAKAKYSCTSRGMLKYIDDVEAWKALRLELLTKKGGSP